MIRILFYLFIVVLLGIGFGWVANSSSDFVLTIGQTRIATSGMMAFVVFIVSVFALFVLRWLLSTIFLGPKRLFKKLEVQRQKKGNALLLTGMQAIFSGDYEIAKRVNKKVGRYLDSDHVPLLHVLQAQTLLLENDVASAVRLYENMLKNPQTKLMGLHGLFEQAMKSGAFEAAGHYAEEASLLSSSVKWANQAMLHRFSAQHQWDKALLLDKSEEKALPRRERGAANIKRRRAVLFLGQALDDAEKNTYEARILALKATKLAPELVPAYVIAARLLHNSNETRKANRLIEAAWKKEPHPDLAFAYFLGEERATERLKKAKKLSLIHPDHFDSYFVVAKAAFDASEFKLAREQAEKALQKHPRESVYLLLADIEEAETGQNGRVRQWLSKALHAEADPVWMADGVVFDEWAPVSPISGRLDIFAWVVPPRQLAHNAKVHDPMAHKSQIAFVQADDVGHDDARLSGQQVPDAVDAEHLAHHDGTAAGQAGREDNAHAPQSTQSEEKNISPAVQRSTKIF